MARINELSVNKVRVVKLDLDTVCQLDLQSGNGIRLTSVESFDKKKNYAGWVFIDYRNNIDNLSVNTVIYGHGREDKTVFGSLQNALNKKWQENK